VGDRRPARPVRHWRGWRRGTSHIDLVGPSRARSRGRCSPGARHQRHAGLGAGHHPAKFRDSTEFVRRLPQAKGKIVLLSLGVAYLSRIETGSASATRLARAWTARSGDGGRAGEDNSETARGCIAGRDARWAGHGDPWPRLEEAGVAGMLTCARSSAGSAVRGRLLGGWRWSRAWRPGERRSMRGAGKPQRLRPSAAAPPGSGDGGRESFETITRRRPPSR
jgi:hypothetical protein